MKKINTKEELLGLLKQYKGVLNTNMVNYLESVIGLEFSVVRDNLAEDDVVSLAELEIYKRAAMYNIYNRAKNIFNKSDDKVVILDNENEGVDYLSADVIRNDKCIRIFTYNYADSLVEKSKGFDGYQATDAGVIQLDQTVRNDKLVNSEIRKVSKALKDEHLTNKEAIDFYINMLNDLKSIRKLDQSDKEEIEICEHYNNLIMNDYGLVDSNLDGREVYEKSFYYEDSKLTKVLVKELPAITIKKTIRSI